MLIRRINSISIVLITGLLTLIFYVVISYITFHNFELASIGRIIFLTNYGYFDYLFLPLGLLAGVFILSRNNEISYKKLFRFGIQTTILASFVFSAIIFIFLQFIEPSFFSKIITFNDIDLSPLEHEMRDRAKSIEENRLYQSPYFYSIANLFVYLLLGIVSSSLFAFIFKRN